MVSGERRAFFRVPTALLREALKLPPGAEVLGVRFDRGGKELIVTVTHASLPEYREGEPFAEVSYPPRYHDGEWR